MRYFTADTHFGHTNIIRYCHRPYQSVATMNDDLVARAAETLAVGDELWHLGDVALGSLDTTLAFLAEIQPDVTLVAGNHDRCHPSNGATSEHYIGVYRETCRLAELVLTNTRLRLANGVEVQVSHFPYLYDRPVRHDQQGRPIPDRSAPWRPEEDGSWLLCGHVHHDWRQRDRMINVGVDAWQGRPVSEDVLCELIDSGPAELPVLAWD
jgi:calcineurin-like phosphoesterase family protein